RGRGLKPHPRWSLTAAGKSPASRGRGLKPYHLYAHPDRPVSPASRGRGLKLSTIDGLACCLRRPRREGPRGSILLARLLIVAIASPASAGRGLNLAHRGGRERSHRRPLR